MAIVTVEIQNGALVVSPQGINKFWGLKGEMRFPLSSVTNVHLGNADLKQPKGLRLGGLGWFNRWVGRFRRDGKNTYWCAVTGPTLDIGLRGESFDGLVLSPDNPAAKVAEIEQAMKANW